MSHSLKRNVGLSLVLTLLLSLTSISFAAPNALSTAQGVARGHLKANAARYKLKADLSDLRDAKVVQSLGGAHVHFQQVVGNVPVEGGVINVGLDRANAVQLVANRYKANLPVLNTTPSITADAAIATGRTATNSRAITVVAPQLVIYTKGTAVLAWKVTLSADEPRGSWNVFVNAHSGKIVAVNNLIKEVDGKGKVFSPNPVATLKNPTLTDQNDANYPALEAAYKTVTLQGLDGTGTLRGQFVDVKGKTQAKETSFQFLYTREDNRFEQVMAYYHIDRTQRYIQSLGFNNINNRQHPVQINTFHYDNSFYDPSKGDITLGAGGVDDAEDADVIVHEYGHSVQDNQVPGFGESLEGGSMGEGFGDYLAFTMSAEGQNGDYLACIAEWDAVSYDNHNPPCLRRLDENKHYPESVVGEVHADGEIWSRALFDLWNVVGKTKADKLVLQSHFYLTPEASFSDGANAILAADQALYKGANKTKIKQVFSVRGIATQ